MAKALPAQLTTYDLIKAVAVVIMVIDHIGFYFYPDDEWWRAIGRIGFPVWFFLVGHASGRSIPPMLWGGALVLIAASLVVGMPFFALNALVTIILIRLCIDPVMRYAGRSVPALMQACVLMAVLVIPTGMLVEYGSEGLLFAMFGYAVRHKDSFLTEKKPLLPLMLTCLLSFVVYQQLTFGFSTSAFTVMAMGTGATCMILLFFRGAEMPRVSARTPAVLQGPVKLMGRHTLEIYIGHLLLFKALAAAIHPEAYPLLDFRLFGLPK